MRKTTTKEFIAKAKEVHGHLFDYREVIYEGANINVLIECKTHGLFSQRPVNHLRGMGCRSCDVDNRRKTISNFICQAKAVHGERYDYSKSIYRSIHSKIEIICSTHGNFWQKPINHILKQDGCPKCKSSKGERIVRNFLLQNNIIFEEQKTFPNCRNILPLKFDFYLPDYNFLIEYDGEQHFIPTKRKDNLRSLEAVQKRDQIKNEYCKKNDIPLLRISYLQINQIDKILKHYLYGNS